MKSKFPSVAETVKFNKVSNFEANAIAEQKQAINEKLESITVKFQLTAADFGLLLRLAVEELESLQPAIPTLESKRVHSADEARRVANGKRRRSYELFLCTYKASAKLRYKLISEGKTAEADILLAQAKRTVDKLVKLDAALNKSIKKQ